MTTEPAKRDSASAVCLHALESVSELLRPELKGLVAYVPHEPEGIEVKLDANEAPPCGPRVREVVAQALARVHLERYPDPRALRLKAAIAKRTGANPAHLLVGTGSDEVIALVTNALARPRRPKARGDSVHHERRSRRKNHAARGHGLEPIEVPLDATWDLDVEATTRAIAESRPSVVFIASPNNPTGNSMSLDRVKSVIEACAGSGVSGSSEGAGDAALVIVDEAYVDYSGPGASLRGLRTRYPHLAILRTVSKIGLAALRVGWLEADESLVDEIDKTRQPFNVSETSQVAVAAVLEDAWDEVQEGIARVVAARERLATAIGQMEGFFVTPSAANFLWVKTPVPSERVLAHLARDGILVRSFHKNGPHLGAQLRITIGDDAQHERLLASLRNVSVST